MTQQQAKIKKRSLTISYNIPPYIVVEAPQTLRESDYNLMLNGIWLGQAHVVEYANKKMYLLVALEIFPSFRRLGHGTAFLKFLTSHLKDKQIRLMPVAVLQDDPLAQQVHNMSDSEFRMCIEELSDTIRRSKVEMEFRTEQLVKFYTKCGFEWDKNKQFLVKRQSE